jgi:hypothetical protein
MASTSSPQPQLDNEWIPEGFVVIKGPDSRRYIVPEFMLPSMQQQFDGDQNKIDLEAFLHLGAVSNIPNLHEQVHSMPGTVRTACRACCFYPACRLSGHLFPACLAWHSVLPGMLFLSGSAFLITGLPGPGSPPHAMLIILWKVHEDNSEFFEIIGEGKLMSPTIPVSTLIIQCNFGVAEAPYLGIK